MKWIMMLVVAAAIKTLTTQSKKLPFVIPPKAADVTGEVEQVTIGPIAAEHSNCAEHSFGELEYAGDALGTDCTILGGITVPAASPASFEPMAERTKTGLAGMRRCSHPSTEL